MSCLQNPMNKVVICFEVYSVGSLTFVKLVAPKGAVYLFLSWITSLLIDPWIKGQWR